MYNLSKIKKLQEDRIKEIDEINEKYEILINDAISKQIDKRHNLYAGMGSAFIQNKNKDYIAENFSNYIQYLLYGDDINTGLDIKTIINVKQI